MRNPVERCLACEADPRRVLTPHNSVKAADENLSDGHSQPTTQHRAQSQPRK
jgi:hypothetical protein